jgi:ADP-ribose pyrophosphatase YjhB (NUDIX family)
VTGTRIGELADELRALAANGIHYHINEYDLGRYQRVQAIAAELLATVDTRDAAELARVFRGDLDVRTPLVSADAAVFDPDGRLLLVQRTDSGDWCMPGGAADVGESPAHAAQREAYEESGFVVRASRLLGVFDNRAWRGEIESARHIYHLVFACEQVGGEASVSIETSAVRWVDEAEAAALPLFRTHARKVPIVFRLYREPYAPAVFD